MSEKLNAKRHVFNIKDAPWQVYDLQGKSQEDCHWANLSYNDKSGEGCFLFRFGAGAHSIPHEHLGFEEFYVLEGTIEDNDGYVYNPGDFVSLGPGSRHCSHSDDGAVVAVFFRGGFRNVEWAELDD